MPNWSLSDLLDDLHTQIESDLSRSRNTTQNASQKGAFSEKTWLSVFENLPTRYAANKGFVVDSKGSVSEEIDIIIHDRQYSPFVFQRGEMLIIPAESVYAVFECKQEANPKNIRDAQKKATSVRRLSRTTKSAKTIHGMAPPKPLDNIIGGILALDSSWRSPISARIEFHLNKDNGDGRLDIGCVINHGLISFEEGKGHVFNPTNKAATRFLFELIAQLQSLGTAPVLDVRAYAANI